MAKVTTKKLQRVMKGFSSTAILVIGDVMLDSYIWGSVDRICPEAPVPVVDVKRESSMLGGAGNVGVNVKTLGASVDLCGVVGKDESRKVILKELENISIGCEGVVLDENRLTSKKTRIVAGHQQVVRFDNESKEAISEDSYKRLVSFLKKGWDRYDGVILSDYGKGVITPKLLDVIQSLQKKSPKILTIDPKEKNMDYYKNVTLVTPNKKEASVAAKMAIESEGGLIEAGRKILHQLQSENLVVTLGSEGMALFKKSGEYLKIPTFAKEVFDVSGAGDTVVSTLTLALCSEASLEEAAILANYAAGVVVGKLGTATVSAEELEKYISEEHKDSLPNLLSKKSSIDQPLL